MSAMSMKYRLILSLILGFISVPFILAGCSRSDPPPIPKPAERKAPLQEEHKAAEKEEKEPVYQGKPPSYWIKQLKSDRPQERRQAVTGLRSIGPKDPTVKPALIEALKDKEMDVRLAAAYAVTEIGPRSEAAPALIEALKDKDASVRLQAAVALGWDRQSGRAEAKDVVPALVKCLQDKDPAVRAAAADALGSFRTKEAVAGLIEALKDEHVRVGTGAAESLRKIGPEAKDAVPVLRDTLKDKEFVLRLYAIMALGGIGAEAKEAVPALVEALKDKKENIRMAAAEALGKIGRSAKQAVPGLIQTIKVVNFKERSFRNEDIDMWAEVERGLIGLVAPGRPERTDAAAVWNRYKLYVTGLEKSPQVAYRAHAALALNKIDPEAAKAMVPELVEALKDKNAVFRWCSATALGHLGPDGKHAVAGLVEALNDKDGDVREAAARALKQIDPQGAHKARAK